MKDEKFYTIPEIVTAYKVTYRTVWNWIKAKELKAIKFKGMLRVSKANLDKLIER
jgi:excisionase family DNA binding protein